MPSIPIKDPGIARKYLSRLTTLSPTDSVLYCYKHYDQDNYWYFVARPGRTSAFQCPVSLYEGACTQGLFFVYLGKVYEASQAQEICRQCTNFLSCMLDGFSGQLGPSGDYPHWNPAGDHS